MSGPGRGEGPRLRPEGARVAGALACPNAVGAKRSEHSATFAAIRVAALFVLACGCYGSTEDDPQSSAHEWTVAIGADGRSEEVVFDVPVGARSVTVLAEGASDAFVAIASLTWADGSSAVTLGDPVAMQLERAGASLYPMLPGAVPQFVRRGTFTWLYPRVVEQTLPAGPARLRLASTDVGRLALVTVYTPPDDGGHALHVALASASDAFAWNDAPSAIDYVRTTYARAGIDLVVDDVLAVDGRGVGPFRGDAYPVPDGPEAALVRRLRALTSSNGVLVIGVDPFDAIGYTLGLPGPPSADTDYSGVVVSEHLPGGGDPDAKLGHVIAHEVAHYLGLTHLSDFGPGDEEIPDAFDDTSPDDRNLMGSMDLGATPTDGDTALTPRQVWALQRSALLARE